MKWLIFTFSAALACASAETLFEKMDVSTIGIDHRTSWDEDPRGEGNPLNSYAYNSGIALGDYDSDGDLDIFMGDQATGGNLYRNDGDFSFTNVTAEAGLKIGGRWTTGVTFADVNGDGHPDLYLCSYKEPNALFLNKGDGTFTDGSEGSGLNFDGASVQASFMDFDRDGDLDCYLLTNRIAAPLGTKVTGQLVNGKVQIPEEAQEYKTALYDKDGGYHIVDSGQRDYMLVNDGSGTFTDQTRELGLYGSTAPGLSATWWDVNNDFWPDLYVANDFYLYDELWMNDRGKGFVDQNKQRMPHQPWFSMGSDFADLNGDGHFDYIATDMAPSSHFRSKLTMGDMSADGWFLEGADPPQMMRNAAYINAGDGKFLEMAHQLGISSTDWTWSVRAVDLDLDGHQDLFFTTGMTRDFENSDLNAQLLEQVSAYPKDAYEDRKRIGRAFWKDLPELEIANYAFRNTFASGELGFENVSAAWGLDYVDVSGAAAVGDLDGDGDPDLAVMNFKGEPTVYRNRSEAQRVKVKLEGSGGNTDAVGARLILTRADGSEDHRYISPSRGFLSYSGTEEIFGLGDNEAPVSLRVVFPSGLEILKHSIAPGSSLLLKESDAEKVEPPPFVKRNKPLFDEVTVLNPVRHLENEHDEFAAEPLLPQKVSTLGPGLAVADLNLDGFDDVLLTGSAGNSSLLALVTEKGLATIPESQAALDQSAASEHLMPLFFDADADGDIDLLVTAGGTEHAEGAAEMQDVLLINSGNGTLSPASDGALPDLRFSSGIATASDYDGDGDLDVFIGGRTVPQAYPTAPRSALLRNDSGGGVAKFTDVTRELAPALAEAGLVTSALWSDANGDGRSDLLVTTEWGPVRSFQNAGDGKLVETTDASGIAEQTGWFTSISGGDIDHDGDIDYVVGNFGRNTKYHPSKKKPARLFYGDFDDSGKGQIIEAKVQSDGSMLPVRGKSCSQNAMPFIRKKLPTYESFAKQDLFGIYPQEQLQESLMREAVTLDSALLINDGAGKFEFRPLPAMAQVSPVFGSSIQDINGDTHDDIILAQNFYGPQRETGRFDGGLSLVMLGDGKGGFIPLSPADSGISLAGDATALAIADLNRDRRPDVIIAENHGPTHAFINQSTARFKRVQITGPPGNKHAIGARLVLVLDDGTELTREIYCGGGYLSQSTTVPTFAVPEGREISHMNVQWPDGTALIARGLKADEPIRLKWTPRPDHLPASPQP